MNRLKQRWRNSWWSTRVVGSLSEDGLKSLQELKARSWGAIWACIIASICPLLVTLALEFGVVEQLSDVFSASSSLERGHLATLSLPIRILGEQDLPLAWILPFAIAALIYVVTVVAFFRICRAMSPRTDESKALSKPAFPRFPLPGVDAPLNQGVYLRMLAFVWLAPIAFIPGVWVCHWFCGPGDHPAADAVSFALTLILVIVNTFAIWVLGAALEVRSPWKLLLAAPYVVLFLLLFAPIRFLPDTGYANEAVVDKLGAPDTSLFPASEEKIDPASDYGMPMICIACSGGGSRASLWTAACLERFWFDKQAVPVPNSPLRHGFDQQRLHLAMQLTPEELNLIYPPEPSADYYPNRLILLRATVLSSVSGGSLAAGYMVEELGDWIRIYQSFGVTDPHVLRALALQRFFESDPVERSQAILKQRESVDRPDYLARLADAWESPRYMQQMSLNHLSAAIAGFLHPSEGRGPGIENYWLDQFGWTGPDRLGPRFYDLEPLEESGALPHLVLNTTNVGTGGRLAITNLDGSLFQAQRSLGITPFMPNQANGSADLFLGNDEERILSTLDTRFESSPDPRFDPAPGKVETLRDRVEDEDIPMVRAIRASSNFPFGFPLVSYRVRNSGDLLELSDGGLLDNTGLDTIMALVRRQNTIRSSASRRRVLVIQIDSGELSIDQSNSELDSINHNLSAPEAAMWRAGRQQENVAAAQLIEEFEVLSPRTPARRHDPTWEHPYRVWALKSTADSPQYYVAGESGYGFGFFRLRLGESVVDHIPTSWHLAKENRGKIYDMATRDIVEATVGQAGRDALRLATTVSLQAGIDSVQTTAFPTSPAQALSLAPPSLPEIAKAHP